MGTLSEAYKCWPKVLIEVNRFDRSLDQWLNGKPTVFKSFQVRNNRKIFYIQDPRVNTLFRLHFSHRVRKAGT